MLKGDKVFRGLIVLLCLLGLMLIRAFELPLFYDPFTAFFKSEYLGKPLPDYHRGALFASLALRFLLNSLLSLAILYALFPDKRVMRLLAVVYVCCFAFFMAAFYVVLSLEQPGSMLVFYLRRFLIQPMLLLVFAAALFYQRRLAKK